MTPILQARGLSKRFGRTQALAGSTWWPTPAGWLPGWGPNGAGKTTFARAVATLLRPDTGTLSVSGIDALRQPAQARQLIGFAGQYAAVEPAMTGPELHRADPHGRCFGRAGSIRPGRAAGAGVAGRPRPDAPGSRPTRYDPRRTPGSSLGWTAPANPAAMVRSEGLARPGELGATCWNCRA
jgi:hypothetical protein